MNNPNRPAKEKAQGGCRLAVLMPPPCLPSGFWLGAICISFFSASSSGGSTLILCHHGILRDLRCPLCPAAPSTPSPLPIYGSYREGRVNSPAPVASQFRRGFYPNAMNMYQVCTRSIPLRDWDDDFLLQTDRTEKVE